VLLKLFFRCGSGGNHADTVARSTSERSITDEETYPETNKGA